MLWVLILIWALGAVTLVTASAIALRGGGFRIVTLGLIILGVLIMGASAVVGGRRAAQVHGTRVDVAK